MAKVIFSVQYEIDAQRREDYLESIKEYKSLLKVEGLNDYSIYEVKGKTNNFQELFIFDSEAAYENFDDADNERMNVLISKLEDLKVPKSTKSHTFIEVVE